MLQRFARVAALFGVVGLDFTLKPRDRNRLLYASVVPIVAIAAVAAMLVVRITNGTPSLLFQDSSFRTYNVALQVQSMAVPVGIAALFVAGIAPVSRSIGSWAAVIAAALIAIATLSRGFAIFVILDTRVGTLDTLDIVALNDAVGQSIFRYYADVWRSASSITGFLEIGYAFLAYRGLSGSLLPRARRVKRRLTDDQPREL